MKLYEFKPKTYQAKLVSELLDMAEISGGVLLFRDDMGQIWKLEKVEDVTVEESDKEDSPNNLEKGN